MAILEPTTPSGYRGFTALSPAGTRRCGMRSPRVNRNLKESRLGDLAVRRNPLYYTALVRELQYVGSLDVDQRRAWTLARLDKVLQGASKTPYGQAVGATRKLDSWPLLAKERVRENPQSFHSSGNKLGIKAVTGGTTGLPLQLTRSLRSVVAEQVCMDALYKKLGCNPTTARIAVLRGQSVKSPDDTQPPYWRQAMGGRWLILSSSHMTAASISHFIGALQAFMPDLLWVYPSALETLCHLTESSELRVTIPRVLSSSEVLSPDARGLAERVLKCTVLDYYGLAERVALAYSGPGGYSFFPGYSFIEFLPYSSDKDEQLWEIVGTGLWNTSMPLVRYRTGDLVRLPADWGERERDEVALGFRSLEGIEGRGNEEALYAPDPARLIHGFFGAILHDVQNIVRLQVVQEERDRVVICVVPTANYSASDTARIEMRARTKIPRTVSLEIRVGDSLRKTPLGKIPLVIRSPDVDAAIQQVMGGSG
jgi:phenylacetate-CoA ligase